MRSPLDQFDVIELVGIYDKISDISITNTILPFVCLLMIYWFLNTTQKESLYVLPTAIQLMSESIFLFILTVVKQQIGEAGYKYMPLIFFLFNSILCLNYLSMLPFGIAVTSQIIIVLWLSISMCLYIVCIGVIRHGLSFFKIFIPECPFILLPILVLIEIFSYILRAFSLAIRLSANIMAGHTLVHIIAAAVCASLAINYFIFITGFIGLCAIIILELGVAFLQAYVFTILICIYLNDAINLHH